MAACRDGSASTANTVSADALIVVIALTVSSVMVAGLQFLWFLNGFAWRSAVVLHDVDDAAKRDPSVGSRADRFAASHHDRRSCYVFGAGMSAEAKACRRGQSWMCWVT